MKEKCKWKLINSIDNTADPMYDDWFKDEKTKEWFVNNHYVV